MIALLLWLGLSQLAEPDGGTMERGTVPGLWRTGGPSCIGMPEWQVEPYNDGMLILRQSGCTNYEKPFLYLLFGEKRAVLFDTGASGADTYTAVMKTLHEWCQAHGREDLPLMVTHSHGHGDHVAGDGQFRGKPGVEFVEPTVAGAQAAFGLARWPEDVGSFDLGGRVLDVLAIPGHQEASLAFYDRKTGILFLGDTLYPGRLYVSDWAAYKASVARLVAWTEGRPVAHILGCHIEQTRQAFLDYPIRTRYQPEEHGLALGRGELLELNAALQEAGDKPKRVAYRDFTIWPMTPKRREGTSPN